MKQTNSNWQERKTVKKGNLGEKLIKKYLEKKGCIVYKPITDGAHYFDYLATKDNKKIYIVEVKTKPRRKYYSDTGVDIKHYKIYKKIKEEHNLKLFIYFVDEIKGTIYGNELNELCKEVEDKRYPMKQKGIIYFHLDNMIELAKLTKEDIAEIKKYNSANYKY